MTRTTLLRGAVCALLSQALACNLLDVNDTESTAGRGARVFDPYSAAASGAIRLSLMWYNGCAVIPTGQVVPKNTAAIPYPDTCPSPMAIDGFPPYVPDGELTLVANTNYFLNQFSATDTLVNVHTNPANMTEVLNWIRYQSRFKSLDWGNVSQAEDEWVFLAETPGVLQDRWNHKILFDHANWRRVKDDKFKIEILDKEGVVRGTPIEYSRSEFLVESPTAGHSQFGWQMEGVGPPRYPGDTAAHALPEIPGWPPQAPVFRTLARMDLFGSTNPFKSFRVPDLTGHGALRVTWSQMPNEPFYFPVTFVNNLPATCYDDQGNSNVQCGFGVEPNLKMMAPANGKFFMPGEVVNFFVDIRDGEGHRLHAPDHLPSGAEVVDNKANGLLYAGLPWYDRTQELDMMPGLAFAGPLHKLITRSNPKEPAPYFSLDYAYSFVSETATTPLGLAEHGQQWSTRVGRQLTAKAEPGTYVALLKFHRYNNGERVAKTKPYFFQVGTEQRTSYPGKVGNCQLCHRGVLSLDNLRHGISVDHVEACKTCHEYETNAGGTVLRGIHRIHMRSPKFPAARNDCTLCHFTRDSATRPSLFVCTTCHPSAHGSEYFDSMFVAGTEPSRFGNCGQQCHGDTPPQLHILPEN